MGPTPSPIYTHTHFFNLQRNVQKACTLVAHFQNNHSLPLLPVPAESYLQLATEILHGSYYMLKDNNAVYLVYAPAQLRQGQMQLVQTGKRKKKKIIDQIRVFVTQKAFPKIFFVKSRGGQRKESEDLGKAWVKPTLQDTSLSLRVQYTLGILVRYLEKAYFFFH